MEQTLRPVSVSEIWIDHDGRLCVRLADTSLELTHIYRASASGVGWNRDLGALCSPVPREWSYGQWFVRMVEDARGEYGVDLRLVDSTTWRGIPSEVRTSIESSLVALPPHRRAPTTDKTMASRVGDDQVRLEARELFLQQRWKAVVAKLETLRYPEFMDRADLRRLEIARKRSETG